MSKKLYIWFNHDLWSHDLSLSWASSEGIFSLSMERLYRIKKAPNIKFVNNKKLYHKLSLDLLLKNIDIEKYDEVIIINSPWFSNEDFPWKNITLISNYNHHYLHSASSFFASWFKDSIALSVDWSWDDPILNKEVMQSIWYWSNNNLINLESTFLDNKKRLYWIWTCYYLHSDFVWLSEWSFMWLSSYWNAERFNNIDIFTYNDWKVYLNSIFLNSSEYEETLWLFNNWEYTQFYAIKNLMKIYWVTDSDMIDRKKNITNSIFADIAAKVQKDTEKAMLYLANHAFSFKKSTNLCLSWGVALNCLANTRILKETRFENVFVQPACDDHGLSLWMALYWYYEYWNNSKNIPINNYWIWPSYNNDYIKSELLKYNNKLNFDYYDNFDEIVLFISSELNLDKIIWWFQWWSEFWARALWFRSILASPKKISIRDKVNDIKLRERWRPLAPVIMEDFLTNFFDTDTLSPYMTFTSYVLKDKIWLIPWVVHVDNTARYQTVNYNQNSRLYSLIRKFYEYSWIPILINTSFNSAGEPIIENPTQAINMFLSTDLDYLVIWNFIVRKNKIFDEFKFNLLDYKIDELKKYWRDSGKYFKDVYINVWKIFHKLLFDNNEFIKISYTDIFNDYIFEFNYKWEIIIITIWYHNYFDYYYFSLLWISVKWKNKFNYSNSLNLFLNSLKIKLVKNEKILMYYFDKYNEEFYSKYL